MKSTNTKCLKRGCQTSIPWYGHYPGLSQSHCCRCGMITYHADKERLSTLPDFVEPLYPEPVGIIKRILAIFK